MPQICTHDYGRILESCSQSLCEKDAPVNAEECKNIKQFLQEHQNNVLQNSIS